MSKGVVIAIALAAVLAVAGFIAIRMYAADTSNAPMPQVGQVAPNFTLPNEENHAVNLDHYRGRWVVLYFYPRDMTSGCTIEAHNFQRDLAQYHALNAVILGVSVDTVKSHRQFCAKDSLTFSLLADPGMNLVRTYGSLGHFGPWTIANRNTFLISAEGKIVKVWTKVDPNIHSGQVLAAIRDFQGKS
ncbi:MAG TPA: peroxiredoxin [Acidobacteriaceae bacterium]|nr:peroxiredoxin [Acidobacteriaceae bacterium]